jgi:hypothetical protein
VGKNNKYPAWFTAALFATAHGRAEGWVFHGYVSVLGRLSLPLLEFSEEARDLHQYDFYNPYHWEGEVVAKILVPPVRLRQAFRVTPDRLWEWHDRMDSDKEAERASPLDLLTQLSNTVLPGDSYMAPEEYCNIRDVR